MTPVRLHYFWQTLLLLLPLQQTTINTWLLGESCSSSRSACGSTPQPPHPARKRRSTSTDSALLDRPDVCYRCPSVCQFLPKDTQHFCHQNNIHGHRKCYKNTVRPQYFLAKPFSFLKMQSTNRFSSSSSSFLVNITRAKKMARKEKPQSSCQIYFGSASCYLQLRGELRFWLECRDLCAVIRRCDCRAGRRRPRGISVHPTTVPKMKGNDNHPRRQLPTPPQKKIPPIGQFCWLALT